MTYNEAYEKLNEMERLEIAKAVYNGTKSEYARSQAGEALHNYLCELNGDDLIDKMGEFEDALTCKIIEDNF